MRRLTAALPSHQQPVNRVKSRASKARICSSASSSSVNWGENRSADGLLSFELACESVTEFYNALFGTIGRDKASGLIIWRWPVPANCCGAHFSFRVVCESTFRTMSVMVVI